MPLFAKLFYHGNEFVLFVFPLWRPESIQKEYFYHGI